jgi:acylphosphatase
MALRRHGKPSAGRVFLLILAMISRHLIVIGRVQGVGYRDALRDAAEKQSVAGWVRNRRDGSVEALLQGTPQGIDATISWARRGPAFARVADVRTEQAGEEFEKTYSSFERWPTV